VAQLRNLNEIYLELRDRLDEATVSTLAQHPETTLESFIRLGAERVARRSRGVRRKMNFVLQPGKDIPLHRIRFLEGLDQLRMYQTWAYDANKVVAIGFPGDSVTDVAYDITENRVLTVSLNAPRMEMFAGETSLWREYTDLDYPYGPSSNQLRIIAPKTEFSFFTCGEFGEEIIEYNKESGAVTEIHTIPGAAISGIAFDPARANPLTDRGFIWAADALSSCLWKYDIAAGTAAQVLGVTGAYGIKINTANTYAVVVGAGIFGLNDVYKVDLATSAVSAAVTTGGVLGGLAFDRDNEIVYTMRPGVSGLDINIIDVSGTDPVDLATYNIATSVYDASATPLIGWPAFSPATGQAVFPVNNQLIFFTPDPDDYDQSQIDLIEMPGSVFGIDYDSLTGALWVGGVGSPFLFRVGLRGENPEYVPFVERGDRWEFVDAFHYAVVESGVTGQPILTVTPELNDTQLIEMHFAGLPHEMVMAETPTDIVPSLRETIVTEAEILALERIGRDASWLQAKLQSDYQLLDEVEYARAASAISVIAAND